jgi:hypothetical protein
MPDLQHIDDPLRHRQRRQGVHGTFMVLCATHDSQHPARAVRDLATAILD